MAAITKDKNRFGELLEAGRTVIRKRLRVLRRELKRLGYEEAALRKRLHDTTTRTLMQNVPASASLIERESDELLKQLQKNEHETEELRAESENLSAILSMGDDSVFREYSQRVKKYLGLSAREKCRAIFKLAQTLTMGEEGLDLELLHPNGRFKTETITLLRDRIALPGILLLKSRAFLMRLYHREGLSTNAIARRIGVGQSTVSDAIQRHGLAKPPEHHTKRPQHVPFGYDFRRGTLVQNRKEQQVIRQVRQLRSAGLTLRDIAAHLNRKLVPTKRGGVWDATSVRRLLPKASRPRPTVPCDYKKTTM